MDRIPISDGDWIEVKKRLSYGERAEAGAAAIGEVRVDGWYRPNREITADLAQIVAYLVDWSLVDGKGKQIPITTTAEKIAALKSLEEESVDEIGEAIEKHAKAMAAEIAEAKKTKAGSDGSAASSPSAG